MNSKKRETARAARSRLKRGLSRRSTPSEVSRRRSPVVYCGELDVQGGDFTLFAERIIVRESQIGFRLTGQDEWGHFLIDGAAKSDGGGGFVTPEITLVYVGEDYKYRAKIRFTRVEPSNKSRRCNIQGVWGQLGQTWTFDGTLDL